MYPVLMNAIKAFEDEVGKLNSARSVGSFRKLEVTVLGQQGLLIRQAQFPTLPLLATTDFDAHLKGEPPLEDIFKNKLKDIGLTYDEKSEYIWLPEETEYEEVYNSDLIVVRSPLPIYLIVSKALKAKEKNRALVTAAINEFGESLISLLVKYKVNIDYFL